MSFLVGDLTHIYYSSTQKYSLIAAIAIHVLFGTSMVGVNFDFEWL